MSRKQTNLFNVLGVACAAVVFSNLILATLNGRLNRQLAESQTEIQRAQSVQNTMNNLVGQTMRGAERDPSLKRLLIQHKFILADPTNAPSRR